MSPSHNDGAPRRAARPHLWRAAGAGMISVAALVAASTWKDERGVLDQIGRGELEPHELGALAATVMFVLAGVLSVRALTTAAARAVETRLGDARGAPLGVAVQAIGYLIVLLPALGLLGVNLAGLLLGGAITGVALGIAAQHTLGNFFAGIVIMLVRPFGVGDYVVLRSGALGGEYEGTVTDIGFFYVDLVTARGPVALPNAGVLAAAIGPGAKGAAPEVPEENPEQ